MRYLNRAIRLSRLNSCEEVFKLRRRETVLRIVITEKPSCHTECRVDEIYETEYGQEQTDLRIGVLRIEITPQALT